MTNIRDDKILKLFGKHLAKSRKQKGISQKELALRIESEVARISKMERGLANPTLSTLFNIANALDIPLSKLLAFEFDSKTKR